MPDKQTKQVNKPDGKFNSIFDYLNWRGDITFEQVGVGEVDGLIFSLMSYVDYSEVVPSEIHGVRRPPALLTITKRYLSAHSGGDIPELGLILPKDIIKLLVRAAKTKRFGLLRPLCFVNKICDEAEMQFSAIAFSFENGDTFVAFRGTDDTLVGWKENLNMSFIYPVPAQKEAVAFLEYVASKTSGRIYLGGHSKGGNLAIYAGVKASYEVKERIVKIYSNDGPGFDSDFISGEDYKEMRKKISVFLPQSSMVGVLLEQEESYTVVKSRTVGVFQHDGFSWEVMGGSFIYLDSITDNSRVFNQNMKSFLSEMTKEEREKFVDSLFDALAANTKAKTLTELSSDKLKLLRVWGNLDDNSKAQFRKMAGILMTKKIQEKKK